MKQASKNSKASKKLFYSPTPMASEQNKDGCLRQVNQYGTYNIQPTADSDNFYPAIAQGLPKNAKIPKTSS